MTTEALAYATEIKRQIVAQSPMALMSYAAQKFVAHGENDNRRAALEFRVSGFKHKGLIRISLGWNDLYTVEAIKVRKGEVKVCGSRDEVYFDELVEVLDSLIEGKQYAR